MRLLCHQSNPHLSWPTEHIDLFGDVWVFSKQVVVVKKIN